MFSHESRCIYENNQLGEVICQLRFPEILAIGANLPVDFQEAIREEFLSCGGAEQAAEYILKQEPETEAAEQNGRA